jgi:RHS repeat-associated protein
MHCEGSEASYYRARYYDPQPGRFLSEDPLGHTGDGPNFYGYSLNNPVTLFDPHGLQTSVGQVLLAWDRFNDWLQGVGDAGDMTSDFLLGTGPQSRDFGPGTVQVSSLVHSPGINKARTYYKKHGCDASGDPRAVSGGHRFGLKGLAESGLDPTLQYVGSYNWTITPNGNGTVTYTLTDNKSMTSLLYQLWPSSWSWPRDPFHRGWSLPGGITTQTYHWTEPVGIGGCGCK